MKEFCTDCKGQGYQVFYEYDINYEMIGVKEMCKACHGHGYIDSVYEQRNHLERMAMYILGLDIDEDICNRVKCNLNEDKYDCVDCIIDFFGKDCKWNQDEVCVNYESEWCVDFVDNVKCGRCEHYER